MTSVLCLLRLPFGFVAAAEREGGLRALLAKGLWTSWYACDRKATWPMHPMLLARLHFLFPRLAAKNH